MTAQEARDKAKESNILPEDLDDQFQAILLLIEVISGMKRTSWVKNYRLPDRVEKALRRRLEKLGYKVTMQMLPQGEHFIHVIEW